MFFYNFQDLCFSHPSSPRSHDQMPDDTHNSCCMVRMPENTEVTYYLSQHYISVYTGIELNWKNASDSKQPRFVFMWYVYIGKLKKKMITVSFSWVWELSSPEYVVCQCFTWHVMTDKSWMSLTIYRKLWTPLFYS
jgi:hypothetical protein